MDFHTFEAMKQSPSRGDGDPECHKCGRERKRALFLRCEKCENALNENVVVFKHKESKWILCQSCFRKEGDVIEVLKYEEKKPPEAKHNAPEGKKELKKNEGKVIEDINNNIKIKKGKKVERKIISEKVKKSTFVKRMIMASKPEPIVKCVNCCRPFHAICVGFVELKFMNSGKYLCESCETGEVEAPGPGSSTSFINPMLKLAKSENLRVTNLSCYIEVRTNYLLERLDENTRKIQIRTLSCIPKTLELKNPAKDFLKPYGISGVFPFKHRVIACFQVGDSGESVLFFMVYFQEYGQDCPAPNRNTVYIAMLDSCQLFQPQDHRRMVHYAVLLSYLGYAREIGMESVFYWSCPPLTAETEYIFYRRPGVPRQLKAPRLHYWYQRMMMIGQEAGIVEYFSTLAEWAPKDMTEFFNKFPYFMADFWPGHLTAAITTVRKGEYLGPPPRKKMKKSSRKKSGKSDKEADPSSKEKDQASLVFQIMKRKLRDQRDNFYHIQLANVSNEKSEGENTEPIIANEMIDNRTELIRLFHDNTLEFRDQRRAAYSTKATVLGVIAESLDTFCNECLSPILSHGYICTNSDCKRSICCESCKNRGRHKHSSSLRKMVPGVEEDLTKLQEEFTKFGKSCQLKNDRKRSFFKYIEDTLMMTPNDEKEDPVIAKLKRDKLLKGLKHAKVYVGPLCEMLSNARYFRLCKAYLPGEGPDESHTMK